MIRVCTADGCTAPMAGRGLCNAHYKRAWRAWRKHGTPMPEAPPWVNPLVCVCAEPQADLHWNAGMCRVCKRKPLSLMKAAS